MNPGEKIESGNSFNQPIPAPGPSSSMPNHSTQAEQALPLRGAAAMSPEVSRVRAGRLFDDADAPRQGERFDTLLRHRNLVVERIVSSTAIDSQPYVQLQDEWVLMVRGEATLRVAGEAIFLQSGDYVFLPAGTSHGVERVSAGALWLAVHLYPETPEATSAPEFAESD
jgi:cupin 2 domain-containing protein